MIIVWIILAMGGLILLADIGEGLKNYLSNKNRKETKDEPEQPDSGFPAFKG